MGIHNFLPHLPGRSKDSFHHCFIDLQWDCKIVPINSAGVLWQFAADTAEVYLCGNYLPVLSDLASFMHYLCPVCLW